ncbi:hypothetical protein [Thioalkalivibrio sp. AKL10]|uniref:hypothetical protein n=1 Tax=Thioalkalivibrio sp. AKL10 TaxID=1158158 RepID=UPI0018CACE77|nr:hypothetical protein [Thioalkalivibrio sp. AKL10]
MTPSGRFTLEAGCWYALELMGEEFGPSLRAYSPVKVFGVQLFKDGSRRFDLDFFHANYPAGVQHKRYTIKTIERNRFFLLGGVDSPSVSRFVLLSPISADWLNEHFQIEVPQGEDVERFLERQQT